jgi:methionyl-tRNA synthetase
LSYLWVIINEVNKYIEDAAPWKEKDQGTLSNTLYTLAESLRLIGLYLYPVMPSTSDKIWHSLGIDKLIASCKFSEEEGWGKRNISGKAIRLGEQLFPRIIKDKGQGVDAVRVIKKEAEKKMEKTNQTDSEDQNRRIRMPPETVKTTEVQQNLAPVSTAGPEPIGIEDFMKVDLRVGKIVFAERVEKSEKLVKLKVDIGTETRQVVAGIGKSYPPEELLGKTIVIIANLKPAKLMGIESQGMLLAASSGDSLAVATFERETKPGSRVK